MNRIVDQIVPSQEGTYWIVGKVLEDGRLSVYLPGVFDPVIVHPGQEFTIGIDSLANHNVPLHIHAYVGALR